MTNSEKKPFPDAAPTAEFDDLGKTQNNVVMRISFAALSLALLSLTACQKVYTETPIEFHVRATPGFKPYDYNTFTGQSLSIAVRTYRWCNYEGSAYSMSNVIYENVETMYTLELNDWENTPGGFSIQVDITHFGDTIHSEIHTLADTLGIWNDPSRSASGSFRIR